jgi:hypothetical protein
MFACLTIRFSPDTSTMKRYNASKYIKSENALYEVLHKKHKEIARADFEITVSFLSELSRADLIVRS